MTTPAHLTYTQIQTRVAHALRMPTTNTEQMTRVAEYINFAYRDLCARRDWWWLRKRTVINTVAGISAGTISVTQGATAFTLSTTPVDGGGSNVDVSGYSLLVDGGATDVDAVYRVDANFVSGTTSGNLDAAYTNETNTAATYHLYADRYGLPDDTGTVLQLRRYGDVVACRRVGIEDMYRVKASDRRAGRPELFCMDDFRDTGDPTTPRMLVIHPYPDALYRMEVIYKQELNTELAGATEPFVPDEFRQLLVHGSLMYAYPGILNDMDRGGYHATLYEAGIAKMAMANRDYGDDAPGFQPSMGSYRTARQRRRGRVSLGSWFDRLPEDVP